MQRDMSYELDGMFANRGAGELTTVQQMRTRVTRAPGLAPMARMAGGDVRNLTPAIGRSLKIPNGTPLFHRQPKRIDAAQPHNLEKGFFHKAGDLADYEDEMQFDGLDTLVNLPIVGPVSVKTIALSAAVAGLGFWLLKK